MSLVKKIANVKDEKDFAVFRKKLIKIALGRSFLNIIYRDKQAILEKVGSISIS